jgi:hypothetical protein
VEGEASHAKARWPSVYGRARMCDQDEEQKYHGTPTR